MSDESRAAMEDGGTPPIDASSAASDAAPAPLVRGQRISSLDVLRGVAVLGILLMNIVGFGLPHWAYDDPTIAGGSTGLNLRTWIITSVLFEGTMRAMFSLLFGAGVILLTSRLEQRMAAAGAAPGALTPADIYFRRNMWLILFGLVHSYVLLWLGDILYAYGIVGMFLYVFRHVRPSRLIAMSAVVLLAITARGAFESRSTLTMIAESREAEALRDAGVDLTDDQKRAIDDWTKEHEERKPSASQVQEEISDMRSGYLELAAILAPINLWLQTTEFCKFGFWDAACMMLLGMALMKLGVLSGARTARTYFIMLVAGYAIGLSVNAWEMWYIVAHSFSVEAMNRADQTYDVGRLAMVLGHIGAIMLIIRSGTMRRVVAALAACGQMALTNYLMQTLICTTIFFGPGLGLRGELERWQLYLVVAGIWSVQLILSPIWLSRFQFGPAEWLWRALTYWKRQPMLRSPTAAAFS